MSKAPKPTPNPLFERAKLAVSNFVKAAREEFKTKPIDTSYKALGLAGIILGTLAAIAAFLINKVPGSVWGALFQIAAFTYMLRVAQVFTKNKRRAAVKALAGGYFALLFSFISFGSPSLANRPPQTSAPTSSPTSQAAEPPTFFNALVYLLPKTYGYLCIMIAANSCSTAVRMLFEEYRRRMRTVRKMLKRQKRMRAELDKRSEQNRGNL